MTYKTGSWGIQAKQRSRNRNKYFATYHMKRKLVKRYGINEEIYQQILKKQEGKCAICGSKKATPIDYKNAPQRLAVDHCHKTGKVRGLLCFSCNRALGYLKDDITLLKKAIEYLTA